VDYALLPTFLLDKIEILPGPHSALYDSKSIGGVLNMTTKKPARHDTLKPDLKLTSSYGDYSTMNNELVVQGAVEAFTYDMAYRKYKTNGYLRNNEIGIYTLYSRIGYLLPADGFVTFSTSYSVVEREAPVNNNMEIGDFDPDYPETEGGMFDPWQKPTWDGRSYALRLNVDQPSRIGHLQLGAYYGKDNRERDYYADAGDTVKTSMDTDWWQQGGKIQDQIHWADNHVTTVGYDMARLYDDGLNDRKTERVRKNGGYVQHHWGITPAVDLRFGLRYEDVRIWVTNTGNNSIPGREELIERNWDEFMPKSFATWKMDELAPWLRDTSLSAGISKIWRAPDYHGDYNPQGRPAGAWLDPEHGIGYDLVLDRRLWRDIGLKLNYAFYEIKDFIATNSSYAQFTGASAGSLRFSDYKVNLDKVHRHGVDVEMGGHLTDDLSFYLTYAWQTFNNKGDEPAGETELDQRAKHRVSAGLRYAVFEKTILMLDYYFQSDEVTEISEEIAEDVWDFREVEIDKYHTVDLGVQHILFEQAGWFNHAVLSLYVKNLFDEEYYNTSGYPATDRFFGASLSFRM
jgi:iron complex outermembrane receptor protein